MPNLYKLENDGKPGKLGGEAPIIIGSALRVPERSYAAWGIRGDPSLYKPLSLAAYVDEFVDTTDQWVPRVSEAAKMAGLGDRPQMLREENARVTAHITNWFKDTIYRRLNVTDLCSGPGMSAKAYLSALKKEGIDTDRVYLTLVDMSRGNTNAAVDNLIKEGLSYGRDFRVVLARDVDLPAHIEEESQDIVFSVAGIHANAFLEPSLRAIHKVLAPNGALVTADWHTYRWTCPCYTYDFLERTDDKYFGWTKKGTLLDEFRKTFPNTDHKPSKHDLAGPDGKGAEELEKFWRGWMEIRKGSIEKGTMHPNDELIMLEGHRPFQWYQDAMRENNLFFVGPTPYIGNVIPSNPWQILPDSSLHAITVATKGPGHV